MMFATPTLILPPQICSAHLYAPHKGEETLGISTMIESRLAMMSEGMIRGKVIHLRARIVTPASMWVTLVWRHLVPCEILKQVQDDAEVVFRVM